METKVTSKTTSTSYLDVSDIYGKGTKVNFLPSSQIEKLKELVIKQLSCLEGGSGDDNIATLHKHKLVLVNDEPRSLLDSNTAKEERLENGDSVLLVRIPTAKTPTAARGSPHFEAPQAALIQQATEHVPLQVSKPAAGERSSSASLHSSSSENSPTQVEQTLRKVLLALLELSYKFMHFETSSSASSSSSSSVRRVDPKLVRELTEMGFDGKLAEKALFLNNMDKAAAMEYLLNTEESEVRAAYERATTTTTAGSSGEQQPVYKYRSRARHFKPNPGHLENLLAMGFAREESVQALRISGNNPNTACDWLLSDRQVQDADSDQPLSADSELYKALLANPTIHIGLHDPKVVEALEDMVENPWRRNNWAYESAVGNVILQILKLYNKYSMTSSQN